MTAFPTIRDLSNADIEKVNSLWSGLGYYSRAKRLWEGAQKVVKELNGLLPDNAKELQNEIPGVGRYTAGAIASIVFNEQTPVVDGNVIRVLSRWRAIHADPKKAKTVELFWYVRETQTAYKVNFFFIHLGKLQRALSHRILLGISIKLLWSWVHVFVHHAIPIVLSVLSTRIVKH